MMSDIWGLSDGGSATDAGDNYEMPGGTFEVIPEGSKVLAMVENAEWLNTEQDGMGAEFLKLTWTVVKPEEVKNRKINQKLFISDLDPQAAQKDESKAIKKRDRARKMFAAIDANAGGKLAKKGGKPDEISIISALANKYMVLRLGVWNQDDRNNPGKKIEGNWVQAVAPKSAEIGVTESKAKPAARSGGGSQSQGGGSSSYDDDEIPF